MHPRFIIIAIWYFFLVVQKNPSKLENWGPKRNPRKWKTIIISITLFLLLLTDFVVKINNFHLYIFWICLLLLCTHLYFSLLSLDPSRLTSGSTDFFMHLNANDYAMSTKPATAHLIVVYCWPLYKQFNSTEPCDTSIFHAFEVK